MMDPNEIKLPVVTPAQAYLEFQFDQPTNATDVQELCYLMLYPSKVTVNMGREVAVSYTGS